MAKRIKLKNKEGTEELLPITTASEVYFTDDKTLSEWAANMETEVLGASALLGSGVI